MLKDTTHLKPYQFKKGHKPIGKPKGARNYKTELTLEVLMEAALIDPESGKRMTAKQLKKRLSRAVWSDSRILLNYLDRRLGKVADQVESRVTFVMEGQQADDSTVLCDTVDALALPEGEHTISPDSEDKT